MHISCKLLTITPFKGNKFCHCPQAKKKQTPVILYCKFAQDNGYEYVRVRSPDSDIFFILLLVHELIITVLFDTVNGNRSCLINMTELAGDFTAEYANALAAVHVFTHCDTTCAFKGIGKVKPIKLMQKMPKFQPILAKISESWEISPSLVSGLKEFTCAVYGRKRLSRVDKLCYVLIKKSVAQRMGPSSFIKMLTSVCFHPAHVSFSITSIAQTTRCAY